LRDNVLRFQSPLLKLKGIENLITLSAISVMMLGVLVLFGQKQEGCCDVMSYRVFGFLLGCFGFSAVVGSS